MPFIVNCPGRVPAGVVTDALIDFTDLHPTFAELAGTKPSDKHVVDGRSFAALILGKAKDSPREWIMAMGGGAAKFRNNRVVPAQVYDDRVIRDKRWKLWVGKDRKPDQLYDMKKDPWEATNLIDSDDPAAKAAKAKLWKVIERMPKKDAAPHYTPNSKRKWDRYDFEVSVD